MRLRPGVIGSMRAWLPSRRSVDSQRGAFVMRRSGQVRSGSGIVSAGRYRPTLMPLGRWTGAASGHTWGTGGTVVM